MTTSPTGRAVFHLDREHRGVRYAVVLILLLAFIASFAVAGVVLRRLYPELGTTAILSCLLAIPISLLISAAGEWLLKRNWYSGRTLTLEEGRLHLHLPETQDKTITLDKAHNALWWQIPLAGYARGGRERRMPARWYCVAGQLQQDDVRMVIFCYAPPQRRQHWLDRYEFARLAPEDVYKTSFSARLGSPARPEIPAEVVAGRHGRYWLAERNRWRDGVEMSAEDFAQFMALVRSDKA